MGLDLGVVGLQRSVKIDLESNGMFDAPFELII